MTDPAVVSKILAHLGLPTAPPPLAPARITAQEDLVPDAAAADDVSQDPEDHRRPAPPRPRGPPRSPPSS